MWRILAYHLPDGSCPIRDWYESQDFEVQALFDVALTTLRATHDWEDTWQFKALTRNHVGLGEIRFKREGPPVQRFRPVGIWPPIVDKEFILLLGCAKNRNIYVPRNAFELALDYKQKLEAGIGDARDYL